MYTACNMIEQIGIFPKRVSISNCVFFSKYQTVLPRIHFFFFFFYTLLLKFLSRLFVTTRKLFSIDFFRKIVDCIIGDEILSKTSLGIERMISFQSLRQSFPPSLYSIS